MSVITPIKPIKERSKVHYSQYLVNEDEPEEQGTQQEGPESAPDTEST